MREDGVVYRCGEVYRTMVDKTTGNVLSRELLRRNHARVLYDTAGREIMDRKKRRLPDFGKPFFLKISETFCFCVARGGTSVVY